MTDDILKLCTLNVPLYNCITTGIDTDQVIITQKQLDHISSHHPEAYHNILTELNDTLYSPDYIFKDNGHNDTGLVIKALYKENQYLAVILKICTHSDNGKLANSIISGWLISKKRLNNYLRNKQLLYKKSI